MNRRTFLKSTSAATLISWPLIVRSSDIVDLEWGDLIPEGDTGALLETLRSVELGVVQHGELTTGFDQEEAQAVTQQFDGQTVRLPGFIVPLELGADGVTSFILVPFVGACIHVPPPPANQLVFVNTPEPYDFEGLFDPVTVTGVFNSVAMNTELAEIGYEIEATKIVPYG